MLDWYFYERKELIVQATPKQRWLALSEVTKQDGEIVGIVKVNGQQIKSYKTRRPIDRATENIFTFA